MTGNTVLGTIFESLLPAIRDAASTLHAGFWTAYRAAGMPYGETDEGLHRWLDEERQIRNHELAIERIREYQQVCIDLRRQLATIANPSANQEE